jgi:predicted Zn-dependent protease
LGDLALVGQVAYAILSSPYTKEQEFEADTSGFDACRKAGWSPDRLLVLFENVAKWERENEKRSGKSSEASSELERRLGNYFSSHPQTEERLARLRKRASE